MRIKYLKVADGKKYHIENFPCCHVTGSIKGMKRDFWGKNVLLVKCGSYIYNVFGSPYGSFIYYDRAH